MTCHECTFIIWTFFLGREIMHFIFYIHHSVRHKTKSLKYMRKMKYFTVLLIYHFHLLLPKKNPTKNKTKKPKSSSDCFPKVCMPLLFLYISGKGKNNHVRKGFQKLCPLLLPLWFLFVSLIIIISFTFSHFRRTIKEAWAIIGPVHTLPLLIIHFKISGKQIVKNQSVIRIFWFLKLLTDQTYKYLTLQSELFLN